MPAINMEVFGLWESHEDNIHNLPIGASDDDFSGKDKEEDFWEEDKETV